jgi:hypothetical protein
MPLTTELSIKQEQPLSFAVPPYCTEFAGETAT